MNAINTGVSGLQATQQAVDVIANNIANLNTTAFKASRVSFEDALMNTLSIGNAQGVAPEQIGSGVGVGSIDLNMTQGTLKSTGNPLDLAIVGTGYFVVQNGTNQSYTRDGNFKLNDQNQLVESSSGMKIIGWSADPTTQTVNTTTPPTANLTIPLGTNYAVATKTVQITGNLDTASTTSDVTFNVYDSLGATHQVDVNFSKDATTGAWSWTATCPDGAMTPTTATTIKFDSNGQPVADATGAPNATGTVNLTLTNGAQAPQTIKLDFSSISNLSTATDMQASAQDGLPKGTFNSYAVDSDGKLYGTFSNGATRLCGQIALAHFSNPGGLVQGGQNMWDVSPSSGLANVQPASVYGEQIKSGNLETSNVDLSSEFANLIVTQRSFQANSRTVTTSDQMMQELLQLKQ